MQDKVLYIPSNSRTSHDNGTQCTFSLCFSHRAVVVQYRYHRNQIKSLPINPQRVGRAFMKNLPPYSVKEKKKIPFRLPTQIVSSHTFVPAPDHVNSRALALHPKHQYGNDFTTVALGIKQIKGEPRAEVTRQEREGGWEWGGRELKLNYRRVLFCFCFAGNRGNEGEIASEIPALQQSDFQDRYGTSAFWKKKNGAW